jgi:hypothetical protein
LFAPVIRRRFLEINADTVLNIRVTPKLSVNEGIIRWSLTAKNRFRTLLSREGTGYPGNINGSLNIENTEPVDVSFEIFSADSQLINSSHKIEVITDTNEIEIERLSLILFEVSSEILPELSKKELQSFIISKEQIENITVTGYSDILGTTEFNKSLSENRAKNTARFILSMKPGLEINNIKGVGTAHFPPGIKSFGTPAERFLSRTVFIEVLKKWK